MKLRDPEGFQKCKDANTDPYGAAIVAYAEKWADLMEAAAIARGPVTDMAEVIRESADATSHEADTDGITGFMYGAAVSILAKVWEHGEALRRWHNLATQIGTEGEKANESGGTLNPALLNIG